MLWRGVAFGIALLIVALSFEALSDQKCHSYDQQGRLVQSTRPTNLKEQWSYDRADNRMKREGGAWGGVCAPPTAFRWLVGLGIGGAVPAKIEATNPSFQLAANETRGLLATELGSASDGGDLSISAANTNCGSVSVLPGGASLAYTAPATAQTCAMSYTVQHATAGSKNGAATVAVVAPLATVTATNPTRAAPLLSTFALAASQLGSASDQQPVRVVQASPVCGSAAIANGGAQLNYTAPATTGSCTVGYKLQHPSGAAAAGTATFTVQAAALNPSHSVDGGGGAIFLVSQLADTANNDATILSFTPPSGCGSRTISADGQSVSYGAPNNQGPHCEGAPPDFSCNIPYVIRWSANGNTFAGTAQILVIGVEGTHPPPPCP